MISLLPLLLAFASGMPLDDPIPPPREKEVFRFTLLMNTREGFEKATQLTLERDGYLYTTRGYRVKDSELGAHCISDPEKKDQKLLLLVLAPSDISAGKLIATLEKIQSAAGDRKIHLSVTVLTRSP